MSTGHSVASLPVRGDVLARPGLLGRVRLASLTTSLTVALLMVLVALPIGFVVFTSVQTAPPGTPGVEFSLRHWGELLTPRSLQAIANTLGIALTSAILSVGI